MLARVIAVLIVLTVMAPTVAARAAPKDDAEICLHGPSRPMPDNRTAGTVRFEIVVVGMPLHIHLCVQDSATGDKHRLESFPDVVGPFVRDIVVPERYLQVSAIFVGSGRLAGSARINAGICGDDDMVFRARAWNHASLGFGGQFAPVACDVLPPPLPVPQAEPAAVENPTVSPHRPTTAPVTTLAATALTLALGLLVWRIVSAAPTGWLLFSRLQKPRLLEHERRGELYEAVRAEPGIPMQDLGRRLGLAQGVLRHHVEILLRNGLLRQVRAGRRRHLFLATAGPQRDLELAAAFRGERVKRVHEFLTQHPGATLSHVSRALELPLSTVSRIANQLRNKGALRKEGRHVGAHWFRHGFQAARVPFTA